MFFQRLLSKQQFLNNALIQSATSFSLNSHRFATEILVNSKNMAEHTCMGKSLNNIIQRLQTFAPLAYASSWDNVGLLVDPMTDAQIDTILMTNDLTEDIVQEAIDAKAGLIISYHPNIFQGLKSVSNRTWKERIIVECIKHRIAVFSPHTSWDAVNGGVNDWLSRCLQLEKSIPILPVLNLSHIGPGRFCNLKEPITIRNLIVDVKKHIDVKDVRLAIGRHKTLDTEISTVALCAGSGGTVLNGVEAEVYLTGEMMHHDILDATQKGISVIVCNHSNSERGFLHYFSQVLEVDILKGETKVFVSKLDRDPLDTV